jgi:hypothetical protein
MLVFEYMAEGSLYDLLHNKERWNRKLEDYPLLRLSIARGTNARVSQISGGAQVRAALTNPRRHRERNELPAQLPAAHRTLRPDVEEHPPGREDDRQDIWYHFLAPAAPFPS